MRYLALGDSISIDEYPQHETGLWGLGAASLFHQNDDARWPEFERRDLATLHPGIAFTNLTADGATTFDVLDDQLPRVKPDDDAAIVTLTAGGNDMLMNLGSAHPPDGLVDGMIERLNRILERTLELLPNARIFVGTVYDPSDGTNVLEGRRLDREAGWLARYNHAVREAASREEVQLADIHKHFLGHGLTAPEEERWYWRQLIFEPNAKGASEVRRLWLELL